MPLTSPTSAVAHGKETASPLLLLSFHHRDVLADALVAAGHAVVASRRVDGVAERMHSLDSPLLVLDARGAMDEALRAAQALYAAWTDTQGPVLLLYDRQASDQLPAFARTGVTAMLPAPWSNEELSLAVALAGRQHVHAPKREGADEPRQLWWHADLAQNTIRIEAARDGILLDTYGRLRGSLRDALLQFSLRDRRRAFQAWRKLRRSGGYVAFVQMDLPPPLKGQAVHHLVQGEDWLEGHIEWQPDESRDRHEGTAECDQSEAFELPIGYAALLYVVGLTQYRHMHGRAAGDVLMRTLQRQIYTRAGADFGLKVRVNALDDDTALLTFDDARSFRDVQMPMALIALEIQQQLLEPIDGQLQLELAVDSARADGSACAVVKSLRQQLAPPRLSAGGLSIVDAITKSQIAVYYQPQFHMQDNRLTGVEALARWQHPDFGLLGATAVFSAARLSGDEHTLNAYLWRTAIAQMAEWPQEMQGIRVAINLSGEDLADPNLTVFLLEMLEQYGVDPARLTVELTEGALIHQPAPVASNLAILRLSGMRIALDDFGTGYSGLGWLRQLPVDYLKIDMGLSRAVLGRDTDRAMVRDVVQFATRIGMPVLAEGVETQRQFDRLKALGCRWMQGHFRAPAMCDTDLIEFATNAR